MPRQNARVKSVHFNITVEEDLKMLQAIGKRNFSKYVKELIKADINKNGQPKPVHRGGIKYLPKEAQVSKELNNHNSSPTSD
jgi:hypothetical protein